jgi:hypothetical protein
MALRKSDGSLWIAPPAIALVVIRQLRLASCRPTPALSARCCVVDAGTLSLTDRCNRLVGGVARDQRFRPVILA